MLIFYYVRTPIPSYVHSCISARLTLQRYHWYWYHRCSSVGCFSPPDTSSAELDSMYCFLLSMPKRFTYNSKFIRAFGFVDYFPYLRFCKAFHLSHVSGTFQGTTIYAFLRIYWCYSILSLLPRGHDCSTLFWHAFSQRNMEITFIFPPYYLINSSVCSDGLCWIGN